MTEHVAEPEFGAGEIVATYSTTGSLLDTDAFQVAVAPVSARVAFTVVGASGALVIPPSVISQPSSSVSSSCAVLAGPEVYLALPALNSTSGFTFWAAQPMRSES